MLCSRQVKSFPAAAAAAAPIKMEAKAASNSNSECILRAFDTVEVSCRGMDADAKARFTLGLVNCHLRYAGRESYPCSRAAKAAECVKKLKDDVFMTVYTTLYAHTNAMCFYLQVM